MNLKTAKQGKNVIDTSPLRQTGCYLRDFPAGLIAVRGEDRNRFLQAQTTNDINKLSSGQSQRSCLLDRKAKIISDFSVFKVKEVFYILAYKTQVKTLLEHLEKFKFADKVEFEDLSDSRSFLLLEGPHSKLVLKESLDSVPGAKVLEDAVSEVVIEKVDVLTFAYSQAGEHGYLLSYPDDKEETVSNKVISVAKEKNFIPFTEELFETARIESSILKYGIEFDSNSLMPETPLVETCVSYEKGCFQGQEVLARIKSHGAPSQALVGLELDGRLIIEITPGAEIQSEGKIMGYVKSYCYSKFLKKTIVIALVKRDYREPEVSHEVDINGKKLTVRVVLLPFYSAPPTALRARDLYDQALAAYTDNEDVDKSISLLKEAITLNPIFEDAYESLGVILSKNEKLDEAISVMEHLSVLNPDSIMAHTNLSVFYLDKGWKEKAEEEKAISTTIQMLKAAREAKEKEEQEKLKAQSLEEIKNRLSMFEQVLEIDQDDFLANYGKGSCLVDLEKGKDAIPYLTKALELKPKHTVAYLYLAKAYISENNFEKAHQILKDGTAVASRQGDLEPLKKMQLLEQVLLQKAPN